MNEYFSAKEIQTAWNRAVRRVTRQFPLLSLKIMRLAAFRNQSSERLWWKYSSFFKIGKANFPSLHVNQGMVRSEGGYCRGAYESRLRLIYIAHDLDKVDAIETLTHEFMHYIYHQVLPPRIRCRMDAWLDMVPRYKRMSE